MLLFKEYDRIPNRDGKKDKKGGEGEETYGNVTIFPLSNNPVLDSGGVIYMQ
jgi:hypothetical protein